MDLEYIRTEIVNGSILRCEMLYHGSLLEEEGQLFLKEIQKIIQFIEERQANIEFVLLCQHNKAYDFSLQWFNEIQNDLLSETLFSRIIFLQNIFEGIQSSKIPWVYLCYDDCYGLYIELALSCSFRFWLKPNALIGFDSIVADIVPCANIFISVIQKNILNIKNIFSWNDYCPKFIDESSLKSYWYIFYTHCDKYALIEIINSLVKKQAYTTQNTSELSPLTTNIPTYEDIKFYYEHKILFKYGIDTNNSLLAIVLKLFISNNRLLNIPFAQKYILAWLVVQKLCSQTYEKYLARKCLLFNYENINKRKLQKEHQKQKSAIKKYYINVSSYTPPISVIENLLEQSIECVFFAVEVEDLVDFLEFLYIKLSKRKSPYHLKLLWDNLVFYLVSDKDSLKMYPVISFYYEDTFEIYDVEKHRNITFLRLNGNLWNSSLGWCEYSVTDFKEESKFRSSSIYPVVAQMCEGIIFTRWVIENKLRLSTLIRSLFFDELINISLQYVNGFFSVLECLKEYGWQGVGEYVFWEKFLDVRQASFWVSVDDINISPIKLNSKYWSFVQMKEVILLMQSDHSTKKIDMDKEEIHTHFCLYAYLLAHLSIIKKLIKNIDDANLMLIQVLGFPFKEGTPDMFVQHFGKNRAIMYIKEHWKFLL